MANDAVHTQLPIMVRKPRIVWPGLVKMGLYQKQIAGDGNCLFASLSDQLYGTPLKHSEIRAEVIQHMRTYKPLFEHYVHKDDVQQRRALRSTTVMARKESEDSFEEYLTLMSRSGTYGGEPELVAFCQVYDQDVTVHLPQIQNFDRDSIIYKNEQGQSKQPDASLHICYGGDEITRAHYDSARNRDGSHPRGNNSPLLELSDSRRGSLAGMLSTSPTYSYTSRAIRNSRSDLSSELIHDLLQKGRKDVDGSLEQLNDKYRARSPSVSSSHRSSSSKRSLEEDGDHLYSNKRADRRKSTRRRTDLANVVSDTDTDIPFRLRIDSPNVHTPNSTQDTEYSLEPPEQDVSDHGDGEFRASTTFGETSDSETSGRSMRKPSHTTSRIPLNIHLKRATSSEPPNLVTMAERPRSTLRA